MTAHDLVYVVRPGDDNPELRHSLRSVERNVPHSQVWIAGHLPGWLRGVRHLAVEQRPGEKYGNVTGILRAVARYGPDDFVLFNDDFYAVEPVPGPPSPAHRGGLAELAAARPVAGPYAQMLRATADVLLAAGYTDPLAYTLHVPMLMNRHVLRAALDLGAAAGRPQALSWRSVYGNLARLGGEWAPDVKVHGDDSPIPAGPWLSTSDTSFRYCSVGRRLRKLFPTPSRYELHDVTT